MLLLRPTKAGGGRFECLLLHKPRKRDAWQLPQGGVEEGESVTECALRELEEEAGVAHVRVINVSQITYQYDFPETYRRFRPDNVRGQQISFVIAETSRHTPVQVDGREIDRFVWVKPHELPRFIKRRAYLELVQKLLQEARNLFSRSS